MKCENAVMFITVVRVTISPGVFASIEDMPDIGTFNWNTGDDFSDLNYSLNNWDLQLPSLITFGINADDEYGYLSAGYTTVSYYGNIFPTQSNDIFGIRADIRLKSLSIRSNHAAYYGLGFDLNSGSHLYWGFSVLDGKLEGTMVFRQSPSTGGVTLHGDADFSASVGDTYNLAIVFNKPTDEYYLYLNGEKKTVLSFPDNETAFSNGHFRMFTRHINSRFEFDNIEFATIPEPATMLLLALGGLIFRKHNFKGEE